MKEFKCEMCGSSALQKEGDFYVCQYCKTKYTKEDAQKLIVEVSGEVSIKEPIKIDTDSLETVITDIIKARDNAPRQSRLKPIFDSIGRFLGFIFKIIIWPILIYLIFAVVCAIYTGLYMRR